MNADRALAVSFAGDEPQLHNQIMNLQSRWVPDDGDKIAYKRGHRDARHDAAELVAGHSSTRAESMETLARMLS